MSTSDVESGTDLPSSSNSALPDQERHTERVVGRSGVRKFLVVEHTANVRKNSKISAIWHHGGERRRLDDHSMERYWPTPTGTQSIGGLTRVKRVTSTRFISMLLTIYPVLLWLPNANESLARLEGP